jgi:hypothetical protein
MNRPSKSDLKKPEYAETFMERIDLLYEELSFAIHWQRPSILLVFYESDYIRDKAELALEKKLTEIGQKVMHIKVDKKNFDIPLLLSQRPDRDQSVYSVSELSSGGGRAGANAYRALNMRREYFVDFGIRVIIWLAGDEAIDLSRHAPDFWAFRHRVVEFNSLSDQESVETSITELPEGGRGFPGRPEDLDEQIEMKEALVGGLPKRAESYSMRLDLLSELAALYQVKRTYAKSIQSLKQGIKLARQMNNIEALAKFWGSLGSVYKEMDQLSRAIRAYRKAIRLYHQDVGFWIGLGQTYQVEKRLSNAIIAYKEAIRLDPQNSLANSALMECYRLLGKDDLAE